MNSRSNQGTPQSMPGVYHPQVPVASSSWPSHSEQALGDISNQQRVYHPPTNSTNSNIMTMAPQVSTINAPLNRSYQAMSQSMPSMYHPQSQYKQGPGASASVHALGDITNQQELYHSTSNSNIVSVPGAASTTTSEVSLNRCGGALLQCADCDSKFVDHKSFVKHTRNMHQVYQCSQCGESTIGYYSIASHTKRHHYKEPVFYCNCDRTREKRFDAEKRGLTKHQNSCTFYKNF